MTTIIIIIKTLIFYLFYIILEMGSACSGERDLINDDGLDAE